MINLVRKQLATHRKNEYELNQKTISQDFRSFADISVDTSNVSGVGLIVRNPVIPSGALVTNVIVIHNTTLGRYTGMHFMVTEYGRKINHNVEQKYLNTKAIRVYEGYSLQAVRNIYQGEELFIDYVDLPYFTCPPSPLWDYNALVVEKYAYIEWSLRALTTLFYCPHYIFT
jgi:hypothetical protein